MKSKNDKRPQSAGTKRLIRFSEEKLEKLEKRGQRRELKPSFRQKGHLLERNGSTLLSFCDNDYLSLSTEPRVIEAGQTALHKYGAGSGASRLVSGNTSLNYEVEAILARLKKTEDCRLFGSGYLANLGTIPSLVGRNDLIFMDELAHSCMHAGAKLSGAETHLFAHNDPEALEGGLKAALENGDKRDRNILVLTETVFSMDGDVAPLEELHQITEAYGAWLMTDDAHGLGVVPIDNPAEIQMGTLSKAVGGYGGYVCGPKVLTDLLISRARSFVYTTGLPPAVLGSALKALEIIEAEPELGKKAHDNAALFCELMGLPKPESTIVPVIIGAEEDAMSLSAYLEEAGFLVTAIRPPTVAAGTSRLRFTFATGHREEDIRALVATFKKGVVEFQLSITAFDGIAA